MRKILMLILVLVITIQLVSASYLVVRDEPQEREQNYFYYENHPDPIRSESKTLSALPVSDGAFGIFVGKRFCTTTGRAIISVDGEYESIVRFFSFTGPTAINGISSGYVQLRGSDNGWHDIIRSEQIFNNPYAPPDVIRENFYELKRNGKILAMSNINEQDLDECRRPYLYNYAAGVYAYTAIINPGTVEGWKRSKPPEAYAKSEIDLEKGLNGIKITELGCGLIDENTPATSQVCGKKGCSAILSASYIELNIPENALEEEVSFINGISGEIITIYKFENNEQPGLVSPLYYITPEDLTLNLPATLTLEYEENLINNENDVSLARLDGRNLIKLETEFIDKEKNRITAETDNLGYFVAAEDKTPPKIEISASPEELWPPNNKPVDVAIYGSVIDDISGVNKNSLKLTINNEEKEFSIDDFGNFNFIVPLIAKRSGKEKEGYEYKIELSAEDNFGNAAASSSIVLVPHDQRK